MVRNEPFFPVRRMSSATAEEAVSQWRSEVMLTRENDADHLLHVLTEHAPHELVNVGRPVTEAEALLQAALRCTHHQLGTLLVFPAAGERRQQARTAEVHCTRSMIGGDPRLLLQGNPQAWGVPYRLLLARHPMNRHEVHQSRVLGVDAETAQVTFSTTVARKSQPSKDFFIVPTLYTGRTT